MKPAIVGYLVGLHVGKSGEPDMNRLSGMNNFDPECRECRVFIVGETLRDFGTLRHRCAESQTPHLLGLE